MGNARDDGRSRDAQVAVIDGDVPSSGWHVVDLHEHARQPGTGTRGADPKARDAWSVSTTIVSAVRSPVIAAGTIPADAFVKVGRSGRFGKRGARVFRDANRVVANDNAAAVPARSFWRDLLFLAILAATVVGAFWSGRVHGLQKVIVVPAPSGFHSVIT